MGTIIGLDVHNDTIAAVCIDAATSQLLDERTFGNTGRDIVRLVSWAADHGPDRVGLEPSGGVGHGAATDLAHSGRAVVLVPPRLSAREAKSLRSRGKSDPTDAIGDRSSRRACGAPPAVPDPRLHRRSEAPRRPSRPAPSRALPDLQLRSRPLGHRTSGYQRGIGRQLISKRSLDRAEALTADDTDLRSEILRDSITRLRELDLELPATTQRIDTLVADTGTTLTEIVGISKVNAARIIGEVGDAARFPTPAAFATNNGTAPIPA